MGPLRIASNLDLVGLGARGLTIDAAGNCRVLFVDAGVTASISGLTVTGGLADYGGGIFNEGTLSVASLMITGNSAQFGGGIYSQGTLSVSNSTIANNSADSHGGGIYNYGRLSAANSTISGNSARLLRRRDLQRQLAFRG